MKESFQWLQTISNQLDLKMAVKLTIAAIFSLYLSSILDAYLKHPDYVLAGLWSVVTTIVVLQTNIGGTYKAVWFRFIGVLIGSAIGALFVFAFGAGTESLGLAILVTVMMCSILKIPDSYRLAALSVVVIMLPWKAHPESNPWVYASFRFLDTCVGFIAAILVSHVLWPSRSLNNMRFDMANRFYLFRQFFEILLTPQNVKQNHQSLKNLQEEIDQSFYRSQLVLEESKIELLMRTEPLSIWIDLFKCQEQVWESLGMLKHVFQPILEEIFDEDLKKQVHHTLDVTDLVLSEITLKLENKQNGWDFSVLQKLQNALNQELVRFRLTHRMQRYNLEDVENYFVFFYQIRQILIKLQNFNELLDSLRLESEDVKQ